MYKYPARHSQHFFVFLSILILFLLTGCGSDGTVSSGDKILPEDEASIRSSIQTNNSALIIVGLSGEWDTLSDPAAPQRLAAISQAQQNLLDALASNDFTIGTPQNLTLFPYMAFEIYSEETLDFLIRSPLVSSVEENITIGLAGQVQ